ncbi:MAG: hypothetical protein WKF34_13765 [Pyrinomonadaceae bacterium]
MSRRLFVITAVVVLSIVAIVGVGGLLYYRSFRGTPQYSLALLVEAAKSDDKPQIDRLVDINAVVDDFVPQITGKAVELYGRGQPPEVLQAAARMARPILPAVKERARAELPRVIRQRTESFGYVPFAAMVMGADKYLDISTTGDIATIKSKLPEHPLEAKMRRNGEIWQIVGVKEEKLATDIARRIGQEIMAIAASGGARGAADRYGVGDLSELLRQAEEMIR